jgi:hypothetical protein
MRALQYIVAGVGLGVIFSFALVWLSTRGFKRQFVAVDRERIEHKIADIGLSHGLLVVICILIVVVLQLSFQVLKYM